MLAFVPSCLRSRASLPEVLDELKAAPGGGRHVALRSLM
jgi:hypothetical protein